MNHPYELLADLVDGTLDEGHLAGVQAHLDACAACRDDVAFATAGRDAARSLPQATSPAELPERVLAAAAGRGHPAPAWYRWAGVAAAAAVVVAIAIALPTVGGGDRAAEDAAAPTPANVGGAQGEMAAGEIGISVQDADYDDEALKDLARTAGADVLAAGSVRAAEAADTATAVECVSAAFRDQPVGRLARLIRARFEGRDAYIAVYLEGPGAGEPPDTVAVYAASTDDCSVLSLAYDSI